MLGQTIAPSSPTLFHVTAFQGLKQRFFYMMIPFTTSPFSLMLGIELGNFCMQIMCPATELWSRIHAWDAYESAKWPMWSALQMIMMIAVSASEQTQKPHYITICLTLSQNFGPSRLVLSTLAGRDFSGFQRGNIPRLIWRCRGWKRRPDALQVSDCSSLHQVVFIHTVLNLGGAVSSFKPSSHFLPCQLHSFWGYQHILKVS